MPDTNNHPLFPTTGGPIDNTLINALDDQNYGNKIKSGDNTVLKYRLRDGDGEKIDLEGLPCTAVLKKGLTDTYSTTDVTIDANNVAKFKIDTVLPPNERDPYIVEFIVQDGLNRYIFPSDNELRLYVYPSQVSDDNDFVLEIAENKLEEIIERKLEENSVLSEAEANELARQENYQELLDTGVMQTKINERLEGLEEEYAPKLTEVTAQLAQYVTLNAPIIGVEWDKQSDPTMIRKNVPENLAAGIGIGDEIADNDFDNMPIFRGITRVTDSYGNVFARIPKFYIRKISTPDKLSVEISSGRIQGSYLPACFYDFENDKELPYVDVGAYIASLSDDGERIESKSGVAPAVWRNIKQFRDLARASGPGYQQLDIHAVDVLQSLFYVEFATLNSQSIHPGYTSGNDAAALTGGTDGVVASSGSMGTSSSHQFVYRGIEDLWGNVWQLVDGVNINDNQAWVCDDAAQYQSDVFASPYQRLSYVNADTNGYVKEMGFDPNRPYAQFPIALGAGSTTYYSDYYYQNEGQRIARFGGDWAYGVYAGLSYWYPLSVSGSLHSSIGGRLLKKPL